MPDPRPCETHLDVFKFEHRMRHFKTALDSQRKVKIVAFGSSSTAGADNILPYPPRLEMLLRQRFYGRMIDVINRGIGGQEAPEELSRIESDVIAEAPVLTIWQVGTNAVYKNYNVDEVRAAITAGIDLLTRLPMDVVLMDAQYTEAIVGPPDKLKLANTIMSIISEIAIKKKVNLFRRFALMKRWVDDKIPLAELDDGAPEHLHTSEWATNCLTQALAGATIEAIEIEDV
ncbi:SGNH/GDSL hydrolase family protein [Bradyrhizobium lablabi]|uniref:SGNH/GDSL hydrolase family protein n=1 Tax=Bradyrhizobium lablabi TaxID=722472 RepID=UPI001BAC682F|nr:SGNH/GDSL hydrolase family protein [Bradyrhizobium lablabi]MBR0692893.1 SGNH/GDSL hydrolase family protein [Bradyrhizobium lablabi]